MVPNEHESSAKKIVLEVSCVTASGLKFLFCCQIASFSVVERFRRVKNYSFDAILYLCKDGTDGKLFCVSIQDEWLFTEGEAKIGDEVRHFSSSSKACRASGFQWMYFNFCDS